MTASRGSPGRGVVDAMFRELDMGAVMVELV